MNRMIPAYDEKKDNLYVVHKISHHYPPHLHETPEFIYVTNGTLELGINQEFFHMEKGDFAIVFPNTIHHYQVFSLGTNSAVYAYSPLTMTGHFLDILLQYNPKCPVIPHQKVHLDVVNAIQSMVEESNINSIVEQAYLQIMLARSIPLFELEERKIKDCDDLIYQTVSYIAGHFKEDLSLERLAKDIGVNKYTISKVFSVTFHKNFNQYLNEQRIHYACSMLEYSDCPITQIAFEAGFQSQRTFNRSFQEIYNMTPREYRNRYKERYLIKNNNDD